MSLYNRVSADSQAHTIEVSQFCSRKLWEMLNPEARSLQHLSDNSRQLITLELQQRRHYVRELNNCDIDGSLNN